MMEYVEGSSAIRAMFEEGDRMVAQYGKDRVFDFSLGNPSIPTPSKVNETIQSVVEQEDSLELHGYNKSNAGFPSVRAKIAEKLNRDYNTCFSSENILMTVGAASGLNVALKTLLDPGDEVLVFSPYFVEYGNYVKNHGGTLTVVPTCPETFLPDMAALEQAVNQRTKAVIINSPNNPTGVVYSEKIITQIGEILTQKEKQLAKEIYLISDEPYRELTYGEVFVPYVTHYYKNTIVAYSFSKSLSLPGERIGYLVFSDQLDDFSNTWIAANIANRILGYVNAPSLIQKVVSQCLDCAVDVPSYDKNRKVLYEGLQEIGYQCVEPEGAFYLFVKTPVEDAKVFCTRAKEKQVLAVPGDAFGCPGYIRLAYCVPHERIVRALPKFKELYQEFQR